MRLFFKKIAVKIIEQYVRAKWMMLGRYYEGLLLQARFLYRQSPLFKERWRAMGLEYAEQSFEYDAEHFFRKAKNEPWPVRWRIFCDAFFGRQAQPYYLGEE